MKLRLGTALFWGTLISVLTACTGDDQAEYSLTEKQGFETVAKLETVQGPIVIRLHPEKAPAHVENFLNLCGSGFYNGTYFHRVAPGFLIQGGDPLTRDDDPSDDGFGGSTYAGPNTVLRLESTDTTYRRGMVAMARGQSQDSAGSQFFILIADSVAFDQPYSVFGEVVEGL